MKITTSSTLRMIIRARPLAVEVLEKAAGHQLWDHLEDKLSDFCRSQGLDAGGVLDGISALGKTPPDSDWNARPMYCLVDYLTGNHGEFRERELPGLRAALDIHGARSFPDSYVGKLMLLDFQAFDADFRKHMEEEEYFLFPKIMRNEACFRFRELSPEPHKGSINMYLAAQTHTPDEVFKRMLIDIQEKVRNQRVEPETAEAVKRAEAALDAFQARLVAHADLETDVLLARAGRLEQELYANAAPGLFRYPDRP